MLERPILAKCSDRSQRAPSSTRGGPEEWFCGDILRSKGLKAVSFDFFIDWRTRAVSNEIWIKRIISANTQKRNVKMRFIQEQLDRLEGEEFRKNLVYFACRYGLTPQLLLWRESDDWNNEPNKILKLSFDDKANLSGYQLLDLKQLKTEIKCLSGGPIQLGSKGLFYGTSSLECYLSNTDALWPGDVDQIWINESHDPVMILEFKKHTLFSPIDEQTLSNYYPRPDKRKYDRLVLLQKYLQRIKKEKIPLVNLYFSTREAFNKVKVELIESEGNALTAEKSELFDCPSQGNEQSRTNLMHQILDWVRNQS